MAERARPSAELPVGWALTPGTAPGTESVLRAERCLPLVAAHAERHDREGSYVHEAHAALADAGLLGATVPDSLGGLGLTSLRDVAACLERIAYADASTALSLHMQLSRGLALSAALDPRGADTAPAPEITALLEDMAKGTAFVAGAVAEAGAGYFSVRTTAEWTVDGAWTVSGSKLMVSGAPAATHFAVRLKVPTADGDRLGSALVRRSDRVHVGDQWDGLGMRGSGSESVRFDEAEALTWSLTSRGPWGTYDPLALGGRMLSSAGMLGIYLGLATAARHSIRVCLDPGTDAPLSGWATAALVTADSELGSLRATLEQFLLSLDGHDPADRHGTLSLVRTWQTCRLRLNASLLTLSDLALSAAGAQAYRWGHPVARLHRDCRAAQFMQPYGPAQALEFIGSAVRGTDPEILA